MNTGCSFYLQSQNTPFSTGYTNTLNVTGVNNVPSSAEMRFGNSEAEKNATGWTTYTNSFAWTLTGLG